MKVEIDQSGHVEYTSHRTVVADSLGNAVYMTKATKRDLQDTFRRVGKPRKYLVQTFAALVALVIYKSVKTKAHTYVIDTEYPGRCDEIKRYILQYLSKLGVVCEADRVDFGSITPGTPSDRIAHEEFAKPTTARKISLEEILRLLVE